MSGHVVITGASTGIGEATARHLAARGFEVLAGVRKDSDAERIEAAGLRAIKLDVTDEASVASAGEQIEEAAGGSGLAGLVNNAGIAVSGPVEHVPVADFREQLEVNVLGQVAVTQRLLPLLRAGGGRIVNISSIGGRIALPLAGPYAASKFALEAISDSLRRELRGQGVEVVVVEPGGIKTPIWEKGTETANRIEDAMPPGGEQRYGALARAIRREAEKIATDRGLPPLAVAEVVHEALTATRPRTRYLVGRDAKIRDAVARRVPDRVMDALIARTLR
jgi:NAD(P)-dependent dehydrogenase (short-subunit alcohol dehydrogenase family)